MKSFPIYITLIFLFATHSSQAQILINEISSSNENAIADFEGDDPDWIELYNSGNTIYDLTGHYLSDDYSSPQKWQFPSVSIPANGRLIVFASSKDVLGDFPHTNFKLSSEGEELVLTDASGNTLDAYTFAEMEEDFSIGRETDGSDTWLCFSTPTPNADNSLEIGVPDCYTANPVFSVESGIYDNSVTLDITGVETNSEIYFTRDGSIPDTDANLYQGALQLDTSIVIRAISYSPEGYPSPVSTHHYIVNENINNIPIIALTTEPCNLWSDEKGIYISGPDADTIHPFWGANFWKDWEVPVVMEFFEEDRSLVFKGDCDMKTHGGRDARTKPMKPLRILAKEKYGNPYINHQIFKTKPASRYKRFVLRNSGSDFNQTCFRDGIVHDYILKNPSVDIDVNAYRPAIVFINGVYWGIQNIREKVDKYYLESHYGVDINNVDLLEENDLVVEGSWDIFSQHEEYILNHDLREQEYFDVGASYFDLESLTDYFIVETYNNNYDWPNNNLKLWREKTEGAKWRYLMFDLDYGLNPRGPHEVNIKAVSFTLDYYRENNKHIRILNKFLENDEFRRYFINRYADLINTIYLPENYLAELEATKSNIAPFIPRHFERWDTPLESWETHIEERMVSFMNLRPPVVQENIALTFSLDEMYELDLSAFPENAGTIELNTISPSLPWSGLYYQNLAVDLTAIPEEGFAFQYWQNEKGEIVSTQSSIRFNGEKDEKITAVFKDISTLNSLQIYPNPNQGDFVINSPLENTGEVNIKIYNATGKLILVRGFGNYQPGVYSFPIDRVYLPSGTYVLVIEQGDDRKQERFVVVE